MPHQCIRCNTFYADDAKEIMNGCSACGAKMFFFVKANKTEQAKALVAEFTEEAKQELQEQVEDLVGQEIDDADQAVVLDLETIRMTGPGKYELDLVQLFDNQKPIIYKLDEGKYVVDLAQTFERLAKKKK